MKKTILLLFVFFMFCVSLGFCGLFGPKRTTKIIQLKDTPDVYDTGKYLMSHTSSTTWQTPAGGGDMLKATYDTGVNDIVDNSEAWNTMTLSSATIVTDDLLRYDGANWVRVASGTVAGSYLKQDYTWDTPAGGGGADNLGNHVATTTLNMANFNIDSAGEVQVDTLTVPSGIAHIAVSTDIVMSAGTDITIGGVEKIYSSTGLIISNNDKSKWVQFYFGYTTPTIYTSDSNEMRFEEIILEDQLSFLGSATAKTYDIEVPNNAGAPNQDVHLRMHNLDTGEIKLVADSNTDIYLGDDTDRMNIADNGMVSFVGTGQISSLPVSTITAPSGTDAVRISTYTIFGSSVRVGGNYTLPSNDGANNQILKTDGGGIITWQNDATGAGGGIATIEKGDVQVGDADISILDFIYGFEVSESPDTEINIAIDTGTYIMSQSSATTYGLTQSSAVATYQHTNANLDDLADGILSASKVEDKFIRNYENDTTNFQVSFSTVVGTNAIKMNATQWNTGDNIDGEQIGDNTIDSDSIDWGAGAGQIDTDDVPEGSSNLYQLTQEETEDYAGTMISSGTGDHTRISVTYQDATGDMDFVVDDMNDDVPEAGDFTNLTGGDLITHSPTGTINVSSAAVTNGDTTHALNCDQVYDFCETTQGYYNSGDNPSFGSGTFSGQVTSNGNKLVDEYDYAICISTPNALGVVATLVSPFRNYAVTISTISAQIIGGTNVVLMIEQRTIAGVESAGTDIWTGDVTVLPTNWIGGTSNDFTVPAGSALVLVPTSVSGDVDRLMIKYRAVKD